LKTPYNIEEEKVNAKHDRQKQKKTWLISCYKGFLLKQQQDEYKIMLKNMTTMFDIWLNILKGIK